MISEEQYKQQIDQTLKLVKALLEKQKEGKTCTISELAKSTGIAFSTVQRRLDNKAMIDNLLGPEIFEQIKQILDKNKKTGQILGGQTYAANNQAIKDENGHFKGSRKKEEKIKYGGILMENTNIYNFLGKVALEYRLSLNNLCKLLGKEPNEELKNELYNAILSTVSPYGKLYNAYKYLFNYETFNESEELSKKSIFVCGIFIRKYHKVVKDANEEEVKKLMNLLNELDLKFQNLVNRKSDYKLTKEDYLVISKYRLKYAISRYKISNSLNIKRHTLTEKEKKIEDPILREKLNLLDEFYKDIGLKRKKYK